MPGESKKLVLTLDLEEDGAGIAREVRYECAARAAELSAILRRYSVKLTVFVSGSLLEQRPDIIDAFGCDVAQFENHGYDHVQVTSASSDAALRNLRRGHDAYIRHFGQPPAGYRAPYFIIRKPEIDELQRLGYRFDSSIVPSWFPGRFNYAHLPADDFIWPAGGVMEVPLSVSRRFRVPAAVSYMELVGWRNYRRLLGSEWPARLVVDFHMHDVYPGAWYSTLSLFHRAAYWRAHVLRPMTEVLERFLEACAEAGYESLWMREHVQRALGSAPSATRNAM